MFETLTEPLLRILFPAECRECSSVLSGHEKYLCSSCAEEMIRCRLPFEKSWNTQTIPFIRSHFSAFAYTGMVRNMLRKAKFNHEFYLLATLAKMSAGLFQAVVSDVRYDALIPVPIFWAKRLERRFSQTELIARELSRWSHVHVENRLLFKLVPSRPQTGLSAEERRWNLFGSFGVRNPAKIEGRSFLLIDDIMTTGATASAAAETLRRAGAKHVDLFTLAHTAHLAEKRQQSSLSEF